MIYWFYKRLSVVRGASESRTESEKWGFVHFSYWPAGLASVRSLSLTDSLPFRKICFFETGRFVAAKAAGLLNIVDRWEEIRRQRFVDRVKRFNKDLSKVSQYMPGQWYLTMSSVPIYSECYEYKHFSRSPTHRLRSVIYWDPLRNYIAKGSSST